MEAKGGRGNGHQVLTVRRSDFLKEYMRSEERSHAKYRDEGAPALPRNTVMAELTARSSTGSQSRGDESVCPPSARLVGSVWVKPETSTTLCTARSGASSLRSARSGRSSACSGRSRASSYSGMVGAGGAAMLTSRKKALEAELRELENVMGAKKREALHLGQVRAERPFACFPMSARPAQDDYSYDQ